MNRYLDMPDNIVNNLTIETAAKQSHSRRSKIQDEVLIRFGSSQDRDIVQSYAVNLSTSKGKAGLRLDVPDHLRGLFRMFEEHAAALRERYGHVKRAIRFDDKKRASTWTSSWKILPGTELARPICSQLPGRGSRPTSNQPPCKKPKHS